MRRRWRGIWIMGLVALFLVGCGGVRVPTWATMTDSERAGYCDARRAVYDAMPLRNKTAAVGALTMSQIRRCEAEGF